MRIRDIALFLRAEAPFAGAIALAAQIATRETAAVSGICLFTEPMLPLADSYAIGDAAVIEVLAQRDQAIDRQVAPIEAAFRARMAGHVAPVSWNATSADEPAETTALRARFADLVIVSRPEPRRPAQRALAGNLVLASGTPCLVAPPLAEASVAFRRVVLAWDGSANAKRALDAAMGFLETTAAVEVLTVDEGRGPPAGELGPEAILSHLGRHGVRATLGESSGRSRDVGKLMLEACARFDADLLVMGAYAHGMGTEAVFGGATRAVLSAAPIPVLMAH